MANKNQVAGQATVTIGGVKYSTSGETTVELGGPSREAVPGDYESGAFRESEAPGKVETTVLQKPGVSVDFRDIVDETIVVEYDIGSTYVLRNAYSTEGTSFGQDGKAKVTFQGPPVEEVL